MEVERKATTSYVRSKKFNKKAKLFSLTGFKKHRYSSKMAN
ncbi:hypothetical protein VIA_000317 [Vibrio orientalis CIP 102891 = ATCC 33934]|uniref:Uncharacterized protein n=1 Tax=Vibrio orientalis CIP 102891 = ATCC 33934 TaxID=675816 RepID=A0ABM9Z6Y1_VIBOR|nr:hypothetical protein VIA_000317 [Vibrio orientalis CIP 102891 = ATCC 33934]